MGDKSKIETDEVFVFFPEATPTHFKKTKENIMDNPLAKLYSWQISSGQLDGWTSYHLAAGLFIAKVAQWLGATDLWAVLWVLIIGVAWEIFEYFVEGTEETYGTKKKWAYNTASDIFVEVAAAAWMVW